MTTEGGMAKGDKSGGFLASLGIGRGVVAPDPVSSDSNSCKAAAHRRAPDVVSQHVDSVLTLPRVSRLLALDAEGHALELICWLQGPGGRTGTVSASDLASAHAEMCDALEIEAIGWVAVGRELRRLLGQRKSYSDRSGKRIRTYRIPPAGVESLPRAAARWATRSEIETLPRAA
jgi:hypothetical protein